MIGFVSPTTKNQPFFSDEASKLDCYVEGMRLDELHQPLQRLAARITVENSKDAVIGWIRKTRDICNKVGPTDLRN